MGTISILGDEVLQITPDPIADNASELIPKRNITGVYPLKFQQRGVGDTDWTYPFDTITKLRFQIKYGKKIKSVDIELQTVSNQATWNTGTLDALNTATNEVNEWLEGTPIINISFIEATGGTITRNGDYLVHTFTGNGTFNVTQEGDTPYNEVEYLIVAGGGGGAFSGGRGGGGGAGGYLTGTNYQVYVQSYPIVIGAGGPAPGTTGGNGSNSSFDGIISIGGGGGGAVGGAIGGSGGGGGIGGSGGGVGVVGQGNNGGNGVFGDFGGGGGGGAGAVGDDGVGGSGGDGGVGLSSSITGAAVFRAAGGGGGGSPTPGDGGNGGGGNGSDSNGASGTANTGGGGGGGGISAGIGGSGVVIVTYYSPL